MSSTTTQNFSLRTSTNVKTVHLVGSWDGYKNQLPLSKDGSKAGAWKGAFRFQTATLVPGKRYWYYYMMDGYHVSHDPAKPATKEPTTGRQLNILDVPKSGASAESAAAPKRPTVEIPTGRGLSPSRIAHPKPSKPYASRGIREADYTASPVDDLASHLEQASLYSGGNYSPASSVGSSVSSRSSGPGSPASLSSLSDSSSGSSCRCNRYGITRSGARVLIDCKGQRCGYNSDDSSSSGCSSGDSESESEIDSSSEDESEDDRRRAPAPRRSAPSKSAVKPKIVEARPKASAGKTVSRRR